jgi:hypothetical protein
MLGQHPQAYGVLELNLFVADTLEALTEAMPAIRQLRLHGLLRTIAQLYAGEQNLLSLEMARRWILDRNHWSTGEVYRELCLKVSPRQIFDKSPIYVTKRENLPRIQQTFPDAYYLHLIRHPRTQGRSMMNISNGLMAILGNSFDYSTVPPTVDPQFWWYEIQLNILDFLSTVPLSHQMRLKGEDILSNPKLYFEKISRWLNLEWNDSILEAMLRPQNSPYACVGPYGAHYGNDPNFLKTPFFSQRTISPSNLEGSLPWRPDGKGFVRDVIELAQELGYD